MKLDMTVMLPLILIFIVLSVVEEEAEFIASAIMVAPLRSTVRMGLPVGRDEYSYMQP
jgi:hypothetical protein